MNTDDPSNPFDLDGDLIEQRLLVGLAKISIVLKSQSWQDAWSQGITPTQSQILSLLLNKDTVGMRLSEVADGLAVTPATASDAVRVLGEKGLITKNKSLEDARVVSIMLTEQGQQLAKQNSSWSDCLMMAVDELSEKEKSIFLLGLTKIIRKLQETGQVSVARMCVTCKFFRPNTSPHTRDPHYCSLVNASFGDRNLRLDCPEHATATLEVSSANWEKYVAYTSSDT
jgi:DNA-binding MarR family transcriptional regulator